VDDEPFNLIVTEGILNQLGFTDIDKASNGQDALQLVDSSVPCGHGGTCALPRAYSLVILDNLMPFMSGLEVATRLRESQAKGDVPVGMKIVMFSGDDQIRASLPQGLFDAVMIKPVAKRDFDGML
jgi:CheY-like chemotaxis protein